ncbi:MAG: hypothetical protein RLZZ383_3043 [Pseudomonadota bacterium]
MLRQGDIIDGRYEVETLLGEGGLSLVWRVRHRDLGSAHALKLLRVARPALAERLLIEGRIQAQLRHPHLVAVTDIVHHGGQVGLILELVEGTSLAEWMLAHGPTDLDTALSLLAPVFAGVAAAHQAGVLHRDLKPGNILLAETPHGLVPKVTDFGIAKVFDGDAAGEPNGTLAGTMLGTPGYLAPEQAVDASRVDARADVYALGAIAYELLTGALPRGADGDQPFAGMSASEAGEALSTTVREALDQALAEHPEDRIETVTAFAQRVFAEHTAQRTIALGGVGQAVPLRLRRGSYGERGSEPSTSPNSAHQRRPGYRPTASALHSAATWSEAAPVQGGALPRRAATLARPAQERAAAPTAGGVRRQRRLTIGIAASVGALGIVAGLWVWRRPAQPPVGPPVPPPVSASKGTSPTARAVGPADPSAPEPKATVRPAGVWRLREGAELEIEPPYGARLHARLVEGRVEVPLSGPWEPATGRVSLSSRDGSLRLEATVSEDLLSGTTTRHGVTGPAWEARRGR